MARAKNTTRAEARKRTRDAHRAEMAELSEDEGLAEEAESVPAERPRPTLFKMPNVREDIRALPGMFRDKPLLWLPLLLLIGGVVLLLTRAAENTGILGSAAALYLQFLFIPPALFTFFVAGFIAPRASWLVGLIYGAIAGVCWFIALVSPSEVTDSQAFIGILASIVANGIVFGTLAAAFAAWYRNFLRGMSASGAQRRADREAKERAKRREERQQARSVFKSKSG